MRGLPKAQFAAGLLLSLAIALAFSLMLVVTAGGSPGATAPPAPSSSSRLTTTIADRVDTDQLIANSSPAVAESTASDARLEPDHGPLLFDFGSMLASSKGQVAATVGNQQLDKVQVNGASLQFEVSPTSRAMVDLPPNINPSSFVAMMNVDLLSGVGAFTFTFHMAQQGEQQHAVQVYSDGTTEAALFDGSAGTRSLFRPAHKIPALSGNATLAIVVNGPAMAIYVNGLEAGTAQDATLSQGNMGFKAGAGARGGPFILRLNELKVYQPR